MSVTRISEFRAKEDKVDALRALLAQAVPSISASRGCLSCKLLQSQNNPARFVVLEAWESVESHETAVRSIPPETFAAVMDLLDGRPSGEYFHE